MKVIAAILFYTILAIYFTGCATTERGLYCEHAGQTYKLKECPL